MKKLLFILGVSSLFANDYEELITLIQQKSINENKVLNLTKKLEKTYPKAYAVRELLKHGKKLEKECEIEYNTSACKVVSDYLYFVKDYQEAKYVIPLSKNINDYNINKVYKYEDKAYLNLIKAILNDNIDLFKISLQQYLNQTLFFNEKYLLSNIERLKKYYPLKLQTIEKYEKLTKQILKQNNVNEKYELYQKYLKTDDINILEKLLTYKQSKFQKEFLNILLADKYNAKKEIQKSINILQKVSNKRLLRLKDIVLAEIYLNLKENKKAFDLLMKLYKEKPKNRIMSDLSVAYYRLKNYDKAFEYIKMYYTKTKDSRYFILATYNIGKYNPKIYKESLKMLHLYDILLQRKSVIIEGYKFILKDKHIYMKKIK